MKKISGIELNEQRLAQIKGGSNPYGVEEIDPAYLAVSFVGGTNPKKNKTLLDWVKGAIKN